jgi:hypothetical protein
VDSAIDQHPEIAAPILRKFEQVAVTNALAEKTYGRFCSTSRKIGRSNRRLLTCVAG